MSSSTKSRTRRSGSKSESGYILITLVLLIVLLTIAALAVAPTIVFEVKRDREEEMIHRAVQYARAIKKFSKKTGRYPTRLEELENTNELRFLRKRYKDPITGKDFKLLHQSDVQMLLGAGIGGVNPLAAGANGTVAGAQALQQQLALQTAQAAGALGGGGQNLQSQLAGGDDATVVTDQNAGQNAGQTGQTGANGQPTQPGQNPSGATTPLGGIGSSQLGGQVFGGGPIVGVASTSKDKSIRVFNKKDHYKDWQFIYNPATDRGGLLNTPYQPALQGAGFSGPQNGQQNGQTNPGSGNANSPFGAPGGLSNSPTPNNGTLPQSAPQQQPNN